MRRNRVEGGKNEEKVGEKEEGPEERGNTARGLPEIIPEDQRGAVRSNSKEW